MSRWKTILEPLLQIVDSKTGIVKVLVENVCYNDEPKLFHFYTLICNTSFFSDTNESVVVGTGASSLDRDRAMVIALGESIERYCPAIYKKKDFLVASYEEIENQALDPRKVVGFSKAQLTDTRLRMFVFDEKTKFSWVKGYSLSQDRPIYVPAQLVYFPYTLLNGEPLIKRFPTSNGLAAGESLARALCRGICELVERDAFLITWLNKLPRDQIEIEESRNENIIKLSEAFKKYNLKLYFYDITTDIPIPTILSIVIDKTGVGPAVCTGTAADLDPEGAIIRSIEEAQQKRPAIRNMLVEGRWNGMVTRARTGLLWANRDMISNLDFLIKNQRRKKIESIKKLSLHDATKDLQTILGMFKERNMEVAFVDVTTPDVNELGFKVVRVIIPDLQPPYVHEEFKYLGGRRLYQVPKLLGYKNRESKEDELNQIPNPW